MYINTKEFKFEAAHRLADYDGKCASLHGHSWIVKVSVRSEMLDPRGIAIDFGDIKKIAKPIADALDHSTILRATDMGLIDQLDTMGTRLHILEENPTSEVIARLFWNELIDRLPPHCSLHSIVVEETCTSACEFFNQTEDGKPSRADQVIIQTLNH